MTIELLARGLKSYQLHTSLRPSPHLSLFSCSRHVKIERRRREADVCIDLGR